VRSHAGDANAGAGLEAHALGKRYRVFGGHRDVFGRGAVGAPALRLVDPAALADPALRHARADPVDLARAVLVRNDARKRHLHRAVPAAAQFRVGRVQAGETHFDADFARLGLRIGKLAEHEDLRRGTFSFVVRGFHAHNGSTASRPGRFPGPLCCRTCGRNMVRTTPRRDREPLDMRKESLCATSSTRCVGARGRRSAQEKLADDLRQPDRSPSSPRPRRRPSKENPFPPERPVPEGLKKNPPR
jgi:hypothetical protein